MPSSDEEIPLTETCTRYKMKLIESSDNSRKMVVKKVPIIYPSSTQNSPKRDRLTRKPQKFVVDLPANNASGSDKVQSNLSKNTEVEKSAEKQKRKSLDLKLKANDISDMLNVDDGDEDIDVIELSEEEDAESKSKKKSEEKSRKTPMKDKAAREEEEDAESKSKKKSEEKSRKTPKKDKAAREEKDEGKSLDVTAKLEAWLARIATMPLEKVDNKLSRSLENSAKKEVWVVQIESNSDSELSSTSIKMKITRKAEGRGSGCESPVASTPRKTASSASKSAKRKLYRMNEGMDGAVLDIETPIAETPRKETNTGNSVTKSARRKLYSIEQTPEEKRRLLFHRLPSKEDCAVHVTSHHNQVDTSSPRGSPRIKQCNLEKLKKLTMEDKLVNEIHEEGSEDNSSAVSSRKQTSSKNDDITKSAKRKLYNIEEVEDRKPVVLVEDCMSKVRTRQSSVVKSSNVNKVEDSKYRQRKPVVLVEDCMSKVRTRQSSVVKSSSVEKAESRSARGESTPSKQGTPKTKPNSGNESRRTPVSSNQNTKTTVISDSESDDESNSDSSWEPDYVPVRSSSRKRNFVKVESDTVSNASSSLKSSNQSRRWQKRESISPDEVLGGSELQRIRSSKQSSSNVTVKGRKQGSGRKARHPPSSNESDQGSGSEVSEAFRRVALARRSSRNRKHDGYNEDNSESNSDPSESSKSLQHTSRVESAGSKRTCQSLNLQKSPKLVRGKENLPLDSNGRRGCENEVLATLRKNIAEKLESPVRHTSRVKEEPKRSPSLRRDLSENSDSTIRRSARANKPINYNLDKEENDSDDTTKSHDDQKSGQEISTSDEDDEVAAISKKASSRTNSKTLIGREKSLGNKESNKKSSSGVVSTPSRATTSDYDSPARSSRRDRKTVSSCESDSSDSENNSSSVRRSARKKKSINYNKGEPVRRSARERKPISYNKDENVSDSDDTTKSHDNKKSGREISSSDDEDDEVAAISKKASSRPNTERLVGSEKFQRNEKSNKESGSGLSTLRNYDSPPRSSCRGRKTVKISDSDSSDSENDSKNVKSPNVKLRSNNDCVNSITIPVRQSSRKRKPTKRYSDDEETSRSSSVVSTKRVRAPLTKGSENEESRGLRKIMREKRTSLIQGSPLRKYNGRSEGTKSPGNHKLKSTVSSSGDDDEERTESRITQGTPRSKRQLSEVSHNASPRGKAVGKKDNYEIIDSRTPSKNNESDSSDNENNTIMSRTNSQKTPDAKQRLNSNDFNGITTPSSRSTRKRKPPKKYSDDYEEGTNSSSFTSPRRVQTPQAKRLQADIYASPARQSSQKQTPAKRTNNDVLISKAESPGTPRAGHLTPVNRKSLVRRGLLTPTMPARDRTASTPNTPQQEAMCRLHVSAVPKTLPCREKEFANIFRFIEGKILDKAGGCMYISGTPGTGKTATVREVMESLRQAVVRKDLPDFQFIEMNAMGLTEPRQAYVFILKALTGEKSTAEQAQRTLEKMFTRSMKRKTNKSIVLMVDELDILWTRREDVVYNLLDWPTKVGSRFIVLTIANTMDMPERMLKGRVTSRLGLTRLTFQPYTFRQLEQIVQSRLEGIQAFDSDAVQLVARKVASVSGDARRALDICRRATELAELEGPDILVSISHVDVAVREMLSSSKLQALRACSEIELLFLKAVITEVERTGIEETRFFKVYKMLGALCALDGIDLPNASLAMKACNSLGSMRLLLTEHSRSDIQQRLLLNVNPDDVRYTLKEMGG